MKTHMDGHGLRKPSQLGTPAGVEREPSGRRISIGKLRLDRGPLRWWLIVSGVLFVQFSARRSALGGVLLISGAIFHLLSKCYLRQSRKFLGPTQAVTTRGPYRFTRNPFYLGNLLAEGGLLVIIGQPYLALAYLTVWVWVYRKTILQEEVKLTQLCGARYVRYYRQVPRLLPLPWKVLPKSERSGPCFSWNNPNIVGGREIERVIRLLSYPVLLRAASLRHEVSHWSDLHQISPLLIHAGAFLLLNLLGWITTPLLKRLKTPDERRFQSSRVTRTPSTFQSYSDV